MQHPSHDELTTIISVTLGGIPYKDMTALAERDYETRKKLQREIARFLAAELPFHFEIRRRPMNHAGAPMSGIADPVPADLAGVARPSWRGRI